MEIEKWLILDDDSIDRHMMELALAPYSEKIELALAGTITEARELLEKNEFSACLLDFYLKKNLTSEFLIAEIRSTWPSIPIVVVSNKTEASARLYKAGADSVIPKLSDSKSFGKSVMSAVKQAKTIRQMRLPQVYLSQTYLSEKARTVFKQALKRNSGNVLIVSPSGMGRTDLAITLGEKLRQRYNASHGDPIITVSCKEFINKPDSIDEVILGREDDEENVSTPGILNRAKTAVLIIDDAHLLPVQLQAQFKGAFERGFFKMHNGEKIRTARLRLIITVQEGEEHKLIQGFLQKIVSFKIKVPPFSRMLDEVPAVIDFWFRRSTRQRKQRLMKMSRGFKAHLIENVNKKPNMVTMRSLIRSIDAAINYAIEDNRRIVTEGDLEELEFLFEDLPNAHLSDEETQSFTVPISDPAGIEAWKELYSLMSNSPLNDIVAMVRTIAIKYAMARTEGNCTKAAEILGIARQSLYKEHLRQDTLREGRKHGHGPKGVIGTPIEDDDGDFVS